MSNDYKRIHESDSGKWKKKQKQNEYLSHLFGSLLKFVKLRI